MTTTHQIDIFIYSKLTHLYQRCNFDVQLALRETNFDVQLALRASGKK
jgi:hypothetical protein